MQDKKRNKIFISYSHQDLEIYEEVKQKLRDRGLVDRLRDDKDIRASEKWNPRIQQMMDAAAVAVLILSDHYFMRRDHGRDYILDKELPYLLQHYENGELDLLLLYWSPSPHFNPERPEDAEPFVYEWNGQQGLQYDLHEIQAIFGDGRVARSDDQDRLDLLQKLALEAKKRLNERCAAINRFTLSAEQAEGRLLLDVDLSLSNKRFTRVFRVGGHVLRAKSPMIPTRQVEDLKPYANCNLPPEDARARLGKDLYRLLFGPPDSGVFPRIAADAWDLGAEAQANSVSVEVRIHCDQTATDPWLLGLPWNLTGFREETLAEHCGWSFEVTPPEVVNRFGQSLTAEPPLLLLCDSRAEGAATHATRLTQYLDQTYRFAADFQLCSTMDQVAERVVRIPVPEVLYVYAPVGLDLARLARILGDEAVPLVVLNLIGETPPSPPPGLVHNRKLVLCVHGAVESDRARQAGHHWLQSFLQQAGQKAYQRTALEVFGMRTRLWSGCSGLQTPIRRTRGKLFHRQLIKLLLDRVSARREISDEVATALNEDRSVLGLVVAGTPMDHPDLLLQQAWHHYVYVREAGGGDAIRRLQLSEVAGPEPDELLYRLAVRLGSSADAWEDGLDLFLGELQTGERLILSLEWQVPQPTSQPEAQVWREQWLEAWFRFATETLAEYRKQGLLIVHTLLVEVKQGAEAEAESWCKEARALYRERRPTLSESGRRFVHHYLAPLSQVPLEDIERFLDVHYRLQAYYPELDPYAVAGWIHDRTKGVFSVTVDLVERLHDSGFQEAYAALL